jgi:light-regulated signal transduction histidine kinase (bacteriophytochrome)
MVWIGYGEQDENKTVSPVAHAGFEDGYLDTLRLTWAESGRGLGPTGTAIRTGTICSCRNMLDDPKFLPWREEALKRGYRSSIAIPLMEQGEPFGAVTIYSEKPDPFIESEVRLLTELADDLSFGIQAIRMRHVLEVNEMELRHNIEELALTNKELESFSYSISHDLRAPLRAMKGLCSILLEDYAKRLDPELQEYLSRIISSSNKMSELIENMLSLSKVSRQEVILEQVNLSVIANTIVSELRQVEPANNVEVVIAEQLESHCDSRLISMALFNLIGNAWKYSSKTSCARIEFREMEKEGQKIFYVRDNGAGFDMKFSEKLFTPFQRLHTDREFPGTGIGLAIVKRVIEKHRGSIWAQSETGKGATFYFTLSAGKES